MRLFLAISKHCGGKRIWNVVRIFSDIWDDYNVIITLKAAGGSVLCNIFFLSLGSKKFFLLIFTIKSVFVCPDQVSFEKSHFRIKDF